MIDWTTQNTALINCTKHALVIGGPGSGKTTMALVKAGKAVADGVLKKGQKILFLSFARATISRIEQHSKSILKDAESRGKLEVNTYHGFAWQLIQTHGHLLSNNRFIRLLPPPQAAAVLATVKGITAKEVEKQRLFNEEGILHFDLFAHFASELLERSKKILSLVSDVYPLIMLDEFQDTNANEWRLIQQLGKASQLLALGDPEQRIYEFRGASPTRIPEFIKAFQPDQFDFSASNYRSAGTDICQFGNDLLTGVNKGKRYNQVVVNRYQFRQKDGIHLELKSAILNRRKALIDSGTQNWSLAVLVPTKTFMLEVSEYLQTRQQFKNGHSMPEINHDVAIETSGPALAAAVVAGVLEVSSDATEVTQTLLKLLCDHIMGRKGGDAPSQQQIQLVEALVIYMEKKIIRGARRKALVDDCKRIGVLRASTQLSGRPENDWVTVRKWFLDSNTPEIQAVGYDALFLKFLHKGSLLRSRMAELWRSNGSYMHLSRIVHGALLQEHFASSSQVMQGVIVMNIHKAKGKEFDEVIIYEGATPYKDRFLREKATESDRAQALLALRVGVTRAMKYATILTPSSCPCPFF